MMTNHIDEPAIIRPPHLACLMGCSVRTVEKRLGDGQIPPPDARGQGNTKLWKTSTIRAWRPDIADAAAVLARVTPVAPGRPPRLNSAA